jgi:hypothetical protein
MNSLTGKPMMDMKMNLIAQIKLLGTVQNLRISKNDRTLSYSDRTRVKQNQGLENSVVEREQSY